MEEEKELVWLPKSLAKKIEELKDSNNFVEDYIKESKREIYQNFDALDDEIISYKSAMIKARKEFEKAKDEMISASFEVWNDFDKERKHLSDMVYQMQQTLEPLKKDLKEIEDSLSKISTYRIKDFFDTVQQISTNMYGKSGEMIQFLIKNFKS